MFSWKCKRVTAATSRIFFCMRCKSAGPQLDPGDAESYEVFKEFFDPLIATWRPGVSFPHWLVKRKDHLF